MASSVLATLVAVLVVVIFRAPLQGAADKALALSLDTQAVLGESSPAGGHDLGAHQTLSRVVLLLRENYVEPERIKPDEMLIAALDYIQKNVPEVMIERLEGAGRFNVIAGASSQVFELGRVTQLFEVTLALRDIFRFLQASLPRELERRNVEHIAINGMLSTLDPHSMLLKPESFDEVKLSTKGEFGGLGIVISIKDGVLTVVSAIEGTPASRAGLKAGDRIVRIGEEATINMSIEDAVQRLRGKPGTKVVVIVQRRGSPEPRRFALTRAIIKIESVASRLLDDGVGYVRIKNFQNNTYDDLHDHLERLRRQNKGELGGLILDLRNNPGGLLDQAIMVSDRFIERGPIVVTIGEGDRKREIKEAHFAGTEPSYPLAVLVNGGSASASEIVAGALKNHDRALVIGQQTFGKGSVQVLYDFRDKSALKLTIAQYLTPFGRSIQGVGITPDIAVDPVSADKDAVHLFADAEEPREKDLEKHLERRGDDDPVAAKPRPAWRLAHLLSAEERKPGDEGEASSRGEFDFETRLAHEILSSSQAKSRPELIARALPICEARARDERSSIAARLGQLGIDWASPDKEATARATPRVSLALTATGPSGGEARPGETLRLEVMAKNKGDEPLYRLYAVTTSDNPLFNHLEFPLGRVEPGASRTFVVVVKLPEDLISRADRVALTLFEAETSASLASVATMVSVEEPPRPLFAFRALVDDRAHGNGDGVLQAGEKIELDVQIDNLGSREAEDVMVALHNLVGEAILLDRGRSKLGRLGPGMSADTVLSFALRADTKAEFAELRLTIWDGVQGSATSDVLKLEVAPPRPFEAVVSGVKVARQHEVPIYAGATDDAPVLGLMTRDLWFRSDGRVAGKWRRLPLHPGWIGFVREQDIKTTKAAPRSTPRAKIKLAPPRAAPVVELELPSLVVSGEELRLRGRVRTARELRDVYVLVNDRKVYYRALGDVRRDPSRGRLEVPVEVTVPLKGGANLVTVVAREDEELVGQRTVGIFREELPAVADAK